MAHDIHEVRDRANILLERIFAPKEFDSPLATVFTTLFGGTDSLQHFWANLAMMQAKPLASAPLVASANWRP